MLKKTGYVLILDPDGPTIERDFVKCRHCQKGVELKPGTWGTVMLIPDLTRPGLYREEPYCFCAKCSGPICPACDATGRCETWQAKLEKEEAHARLMQAIGVATS